MTHADRDRTEPPARPDPGTMWKDRHGDVWTMNGDGLTMSTPETGAFTHAHVEKKWGPLVAVDPLAPGVALEALAGALDTTPAELAGGAPGGIPLHGQPAPRDAAHTLPATADDARGNRRGPLGYLCCKHCAQDTVHDVETDGHDGPCQTCDDPGAILRERLEAAEALVVELRREVTEVVARWESDRNTCLAWIADPTMHVDEDHPTRLSDKADMLNRHAQEIRAAAALSAVLDVQRALAEPEECPHVCSCTSDGECPHDCDCTG